MTEKPLEMPTAAGSAGADQAAVMRQSVERVAAGAGTRGVRVVDREALLLDGVDEVDGGPGQVGGAHLVRDDLDTAELAHEIAVDLALVEVQLIAQARAATWLHGNTEPQVIAALLLQQVAHLHGCCLSEDNALGGRLILNCHFG